MSKRTDDRGPLPLFLLRRCQFHIGKGIILLLARLVHRLPRRRALALGRALGRLAPRLSRRHYRLVCTDMAAAFGEEAAAPAVKNLALQSYERLGENLVEFLRLPYMTCAELRELVHYEGLEHLETALAAGHGAIVITGHLANWEAMGTAVGNLPYKVAAVAKIQEDSAMNALFTRIRERHGLHIVSMTDVRECIRRLKSNECLALLSDVNAKVPGAFINFFGRPAATYTGAAYLAMLTGAPILSVFDERLDDSTHVCRIGPPIPVSRTGDRPRDVLITTMRVQQVIENEVRRRPQDWYWLVNRWKTRPEKVANPDALPMEHRDLTPAESAAIRQDPYAEDVPVG